MPNTYDLSGKSAIVTGGAKGIGRAIAECLAAAGAHVATWDLGTVDVTVPGQIDRALAQFLAERSRIDILVNNAGYLGRLHRFEEHERDDWQRIIQVNLVGMMQVAQAVLPYMRRQGSGRIVNMGSLAGKEGLANLVAYSAASAGVIAFTKALGREVAGTGILVNCVAPGPIDTGMIRDLGPQAVEAMIQDSPLKQLGKPDDVARLVAWLASEDCRFNTGAIFDMSGGRARY